MRPFVRTRTVGVVGALGLIVIAVMLLRGDLILLEATRRAAILLAGVLVLEHLVLPVARLLVGEPRPTEDEGEGEELADGAQRRIVV